MAHAKTPWKSGLVLDPITISGHKHKAWEVVSPEDGCGVCVVILPHEDVSPSVERERIETRDHIVRAVNAFEPMREALQTLISILEATNTCLESWNHKGSPVNVDGGIEQARAALALADKERP